MAELELEQEQEQQRKSKWQLRSGQYLGEISALCFLHLPSAFSSLPYLLAGTGSQMLLYNLEEIQIIESFQVFEGIRVHGITCSSADNPRELSSTRLACKVAVLGEKRVKLFSFHVDLEFKSQNQSNIRVDLALVYSLPKFSHWVLDVSFLKNAKESHCLAIGCSDNSVCLWNMSSSSMILQVQSSEKCLLYSMRLWGDNLEALRIASGTIFNEIIIWKVVPHDGALPLRSGLEDDMHLNNSCSNSVQLHCQQYKAANISRLVGHEGSIFRIVWSSDGSKLVSVSDDRSARIWAVEAEQKDSDDQAVENASSLLFGHTARVWDCCIVDSLVVTAGEDCTCRVWALDGEQLKMIKEHIGRGVWRCLYDSNSSLLITAGFDSAIKVHQLPASFPQSLEGRSESEKFIGRIERFTSRIPNSYEHTDLMDSKSEYVRCMHFTCEDTLYIATNHGYLYRAQLFQNQDLNWTKVVQVCEKVPIVCMDLLSNIFPRHSCAVDDWVALGDGKGNLTIVRVVGDVSTPNINFTFAWSAEKERQLLGTYWCKALGYRFIFTADPKGVLKMWKLHDPLLSVSHTSTFAVSLVAEFTSCFGNRIMCIDASSCNETLICGDLRGNLVLFPLAKSLLLNSSAEPGAKISPLSYFKGAHGISSVSSISVAKLSFSETEICSTGADGCICYFEYDQARKSLEFIGMEQVKELSLIQSVSTFNNSADSSNTGHAIGFASTDFIIWNLTTETKVLQIPCGGWRRPHAYYLGDVPEMDACFAYVKDEIIYIHRQWVPESERKIFPCHLHIQFHGRELHSLCFVSENAAAEENGNDGLIDKSSWIATGCEDGTVRLSRYSPGVKSWTASKMLGEHVGGSAVRSICFVSKMHIIPSDITNVSDWRNKQNAFEEHGENPLLLISVGAKRVLTSWLLRERRLDNKRNPLAKQEGSKSGKGCMPHVGVSSSMSFKWLSTDMPAKNSCAHSHRKTKNIHKIGGNTENAASMETDAKSRHFSLGKRETESKGSLDDKDEDDWRYLAVTAFLVKFTGSRLTVCFIIVACSDATLALRALVLPHRLWFDIALLGPLSSPVLTLQHVIIPAHLPPRETTWIGNAYIVISGATDGSIALWDLTESVESFVRQLSVLDVEKLINCPTRPRTGRGSQGGRWWKSLRSSISKNKPIDGLVSSKAGERTSCNSVNHASDAESCNAVSQSGHNVFVGPEVNNVDTITEIYEVQPLHVLNNVHQSGVNCLHVSDMYDSWNSDSGFLFTVISGGDDQALHCLKFEKSLLSTHEDSDTVTPKTINAITKSPSTKSSIPFSECLIKKYGIRLSYHDRVPSAHSSAVKGVWTDGTWVFSTGLDQRIRCWLLEEHCKLTEKTHLVISVPEPEALHARACERNRYEIVVAGRGMQMVEFLAS